MAPFSTEERGWPYAAFSFQTYRKLDHLTTHYRTSTPQWDLQNRYRCETHSKHPHKDPDLNIGVRTNFPLQQGQE
jgi:hypothetical protein